MNFTLMAYFRGIGTTSVHEEALERLFWGNLATAQRSVSKLFHLKTVGCKDFSANDTTRYNFTFGRNREQPKQI